MVTGAAGFIGGRIVAQLREMGVEVVAVDAMIAEAHGADASTPSDVIRADITDVDTIAAHLDGVDVVCHQAAMVGMGVTLSDAPLYARHNDLGTAALLAAMHRVGCRRLVLASSMVVYGSGRLRTEDGEPVESPPARDPDRTRLGDFEYHTADGRPITWELTDEDAPLRPASLYAASKVAQEHYARAWSVATGGSVVALRYHNVYGPGMPRDTPYAGVASIFRSRLASGQAPLVFEDGGQMRDFVHVDDVAAANVAAIGTHTDGFSALNVCSGRPITIGEVAEILARQIDGPSPVITGELRPGDIRHIVADPARARDVLGFTAQVSPEQGLAEFATAPLRAPAR
ncbi:NAD-dependent epimerase/dehydratase family protein [Gordonia sp. PKS22-38]|uniref:NAD-dependent epimerase/dehydratase family protein n=1 Tax=Gordonia prachuapensis TaxID=3115651 RepID=A0ABU7MTQ0_9ACTN|nr:NAD-dependent epimerase/dehydratase family protein [Gordonia sp. PKS22-38]